MHLWEVGRWEVQVGGMSCTNCWIRLAHRPTLSDKERSSKPLSGSAAFSLTGMRAHDLDWLD